MSKPQRLLVQIGSDRFHTEIANVNDSARPTEIISDRFVGRVLVRVANFSGVTPDGSPPISDDPYFVGRSRQFSIQIEGRFLERPGVPSYTADEIHFGSDFDRLIDFPRSAFNAGMKVAQWVDPATFYDERPPNGRPYIMSPYAACQNTVAAWPAPKRSHEAVVALRHTEEEDEGAAKHGVEDVPEGCEDLVPVEVLDSNGNRKVGRHLKRYWRFIGFKNDPKVQAYIQTHAPHLLTSTASPSIASPRPTISHKASLGVLPRSNSPASYSSGTPSITPTASPVSASTGAAAAPAKKSSSKFGSIFSKLGGSGSNSGSTTPVSADDVTLASNLHPHHEILPGVSTKLDAELGPWRFADKGSDAVEDNSFVFVDSSVSTPKRRKYFASQDNRQAFVYDPDVVYSTSFFAPFCDLNTLDLKIGPVRMNLTPFFHDMPIRYTLRSTRKELVNGIEEEEVFATISFQLVD